MPAVTVESVEKLPSLGEIVGEPRVLRSVTKGRAATEGAGFPVFRGFAGLNFTQIDPFLLLDQLGPVENAPFETKGAPWHPHRGFETVSYIIDGEVAHHDSHGGGGVIYDGDTQWMTAGAGVLHDEMPTDRVYEEGGLQHSIQLWVNLPSAKKMIPPAYQAIAGPNLTLIGAANGQVLIRLIAGSLGEFSGPGSTNTPITLAHITMQPGSEVTLPWNPAFNAMAYALTGEGFAGVERAELAAHHMAYFEMGGDTITLAAHPHQTSADALDLLVLGGLPIGEPVVQYGPFVMNTEQEIRQAMTDYNNGKFGSIPD